MTMATKIVLLDKGVIQQYDKPQNLYLNPANLFVAKFIGNPIINIFEFEKKDDKLISSDLKLKLDDFEKERFKKELNDGDYLVGIRPEHFILDKESDIRVKVDSIEMIGRYMILHFDLDDVSSKMIVDSKLEIKAGNEI